MNLKENKMSIITLKTPLKTKPLKVCGLVEAIIKNELNAKEWITTAYKESAVASNYKKIIKATYEGEVYILYGVFPTEVFNDDVTLAYDYSEKEQKNNMLEYTWKYEKPQNPRNGAWEQELFRTIYTVCLKACQELRVNENSWSESMLIRLEADSATVCALETMEQFNLQPGENTLSMCYRVGKLGRFEVWRNLQADNNYILITYNGKVARINIEGLCNSPII